MGTGPTQNKARRFESCYPDEEKISSNFEFCIIYNTKKNVVLLNISDFDDLYTKSLEEFSIKEKPDNLLSLYSYIKNVKMTYRVPISNKLVRNKLIDFRLRSLNIFVYKINKLIYFILSELHYKA